MKRLIAFGLLVACLPAPSLAKTYVSLSGRFTIAYPDDWEQYDYNTVDLYLMHVGADSAMFNYDAVLAPSSSNPFYAADYLFLTLDTMGELSSSQVDSVLGSVTTTFQKGVRHCPITDFLADIRSNEPCYDKDNKIVAVLHDAAQIEQMSKKNLIMMKFYESGVATFYFYSPDSLFDRSKKTFYAIVASFSTENIEDALPKEQLKVADLDQRTAAGSGNDESQKSRTTLTVSFVVLILIVTLALLRRRQRRS